jgi:hypothetical protein
MYLVKDVKFECTARIISCGAEICPGYAISEGGGCCLRLRYSFNF